MKKILSIFVSALILFALNACSVNGKEASSASDVANPEDKEYIENTLNLANNADQEWTYYADSDAWVLSVVSAVAYPELPDQQGVSVCVPGAYVTGIDTDGDETADITSETYASTVKGALVIDYDAQITSTNGQVYTAATAPVILNTGAAGYASSTNSAASASYALEGYINVACGNRGKQDTATDESGNTYYTGDAPCCLVDQKDAARYVKYNILLGNLPGSVDYLVSTGGSGGAAHAAMFAATSNNSDFYNYEIESGAVGVYKNTDGTYSTTVTIDGTDYEISDGAWGCVAYSAITSLYEGDITMAFEYYMDTTYSFGSSFQMQLAQYLSASYMDYINSQNLSVKETSVGFDLNDDGDTDDMIALTIEYDPDSYPETNGYHGTYLDLYLAEFTQNLQWYLDNLDYADGWTWFDDDGNALSDEEVAAMTSADKAEAFIEGRYAKGSSTNEMGGPGGDMEGTIGDFPNGTLGVSGGDMGGTNGAPGGFPGGAPSDVTGTGDNNGNATAVGTPDAGTTQSATGQNDSANYETYNDMVEAYKADIEEIEAGDQYDNNIVSLYNPLNYINADDTENPTWTRIVMGAAEGDMSMFASLNLQIAWLSGGVDAVIEWQWDGGHVPSEIFGNSLSLYVDEMYGKHVEGAVTITKDAATPQTQNGTAETATGTDISGWVNYDDVTNVSFSLADAAAYRTAGASKAIPGFDVIDYGQEDYVFGNTEKDARHWDTYVLDALEKYADVLEPLFNAG
ncbi:MAG TPA: hypothetical protein PK629_07305 [Oscillospiraceae bacterium]|nr:hypothetical protein [Oscillospiraceae bacterium]HPF56748.1 hypothetical protein [Clostridiales bacterium]HPK34362.1 hypothetical protein [Oscillospiraceae bacterium]HPR76928.1 hypothetical protein [Oscillospiraceae bacterium]